MLLKLTRKNLCRIFLRIKLCLSSETARSSNNNINVRQGEGRPRGLAPQPSIGALTAQLIITILKEAQQIFTLFFNTNSSLISMIIWCYVFTNLPIVSDVHTVKVTLYLARPHADLPTRNFFAQCTLIHRWHGRLTMWVNEIHPRIGPCRSIFRYQADSMEG